jgi:hypothetical protein
MPRVDPRLPHRPQPAFAAPRPRRTGPPQAAEAFAAALEAGPAAPGHLASGPAQAKGQRPAEPTAVAPTLRPGDRLLVGTAGGEVRLSLGAGVEIHLRSRGGEISVLVLTAAESSRKTLATAMEEVARRLARRGIAFRVRAQGEP